LGRPGRRRAGARRGSGAAGQVGRAAAVRSGGPELPVAHRAGQWTVAVRLAAALLGLPAEAGEGSPVLADPGTAGARDRAVPLAEAGAGPSGAVRAPAVPRSRPDRRESALGAAADRDRRPVAAGRDPGPRDPGSVLRPAAPGPPAEPAAAAPRADPRTG